MKYTPTTDKFHDTIHLVDQTTPVQGGAPVFDAQGNPIKGASNASRVQLADNIAYLKKGLETATTVVDGETTSTLDTYVKETRNELIKNTARVVSYAALRDYSGEATIIDVISAGIAATVYHDPTDVTSLDNGVTVFVGSDGRRWKRQYLGAIHSSWCEDTAKGIALAANGEYQIDAGTHPAITTVATNIKGLGNSSVISAISGSVITAGWGIPHWTPKKISAVSIKGNGTANGITLSRDNAPEVAGRWTIEQALIENCVRGFYKPKGNIGNRLRDVNFGGNQYGYYTLGNSAASPATMHNGCDSLTDCHFEGNSIAAFYSNNNDVQGGGQISLRNTTFEANTGFGVVLKNHTHPRFGAILLDNVWFELNSTSSTVNLDGVEQYPYDLYLDNSNSVIVRNGMIPRKTKIANHSSIIFDGCTTPYGIDTEMVVDTATCTVIAINADMHGAVIPVTVDSIAAVKAPAGNRAGAFYSRTRTVNSINSTSKVIRQGFELDQAYTFTGTVSLNSTPVVDGTSFSRCAELSIPAGNSALFGGAFNVPASYVVIGIDAKLISGNLSLFCITGGGSLIPDAKALLRDKWTTIRSVGKADAAINSLYLYITASTNAVIRLSAFDVAIFNTEQEAINYYNSMTF